MDYISWKNQSLTTAEMVPISILVLEALLGVACNLVAAVTYCRQRQNWLHNAGNAFTVSLMIDDLILSGIATPLVVAIEITKISGSPKLMEYLCVSARCTLLFSAVSSATGNALLALDRGDLTIRPSKRFFRQKRAGIALGIAWFLSIASLLLPLLSTWTCQDATNQVQFSSEAIYKALNEDIESGFNNSIQCNITCYANHCSVNETEFIIRCAIQVLFFTCAAVTIIATYTRIIHSVKRRDIKRATKNIELNAGLYSSKKKTKCYLYRWSSCCKVEEKTLLEKTITKNQESRVESPCTPLQAVKQGSTVSKSTIESFPDTDQSRKSEEDTKGETSNFIKKTAEIPERIHPGRAHFASVALSVQAFIALKRIVKEKMEIKRRKHRHLQRMTIAITLTYLLCWMPYHILPFVTLLTNQFPQSYTCALQECIDSGIMHKDIQQAMLFRQSSYPLNIGFLWTFVFVSISSIANPCLYGFSREKIRKEFSKIFCKSKNINSPLNTKSPRTKSKKFEANKPTETTLRWKKVNQNKSNTNKTQH